MTASELKFSLSNMQGKLFMLSGNMGYDSECFIRLFMNSKIAEGLDSDFDYLQWAGKEYILEKMTEEYSNEMHKSEKIYDGETLYWTGYLYRRWHFYTGQSSRIIYKAADAKLMNSSYLGLHTLDVEAAIDILNRRV